MTNRLPAIAFILLGALPLSAQYPTQKQVPPPGIAVPDPERAELTASLEALGKEIAALRSIPAAGALLPDVEIFHKAVDYALRYNEFMDAKQLAAAKPLLAEGLARAKALRSGQAPWTTQTGLVVRGFRSRIDGSVQPYGLIVPPTWKAGDKRPRRLDIFNHGRGDTLTEISFIAERMRSKGEFTPEDSFVLHPYGRFCNATKFAGETDVFEAMSHVQRNYPVDSNRIVMLGFSMGGASVWHLGTHYAWLWAAASPGAGFAETPIYTKAFAPGKDAPPWWEQVLWRLYNATDYAANLANTSLIAYSGEDDPQKASADIMEKTAAAEGLTLERLVGPKTGHKYEPETKKELIRRLGAYAAKGRDEVPAKVRLVTYTLRYNRQEWVEVTALEKHWERAQVDAEIVDEGTVKLATKNVAALTLDMHGGAIPLDKTRPPRLVVDGQELVGPAVTNPWTAHLRKDNGKWVLAKSPTEDAPTLRKQHQLQGPIDDAFMDSFVFVRPTGKPLNDAVGAWTKSELERATNQWRQVFRGNARVVDDRAVTPELIANANLVLWGDPSSNSVLAKIASQLPIKWNATDVQLGTLRGDASYSVPVLIYPNPLNPKHYVVLNSSFTFRQGSNASNATQTPKLPDWALIDLRTPPSEKAPGLVIDAGFFDEQWRFPSADKKLSVSVAR
ncbi:prolyl oligopeptidase family serine peptidase [Verrucomicrobiota bacterium sgz303538]